MDDEERKKIEEQLKGIGRLFYGMSWLDILFIVGIWLGPTILLVILDLLFNFL